MNKYWNGSFWGLPHALIAVLFSSARFLYRKVYSRVIVSNLGGGSSGISISRGFLCRFPKRIVMERNVSIDEDVHITTEDNSSSLILEEGVSIGNNTSIDYTGGIIVRRMAHIANNVYLLTHSHGYDYTSKPVGSFLEIGEHAFVGAHTCIMFGCNYIGKYSVVGTGSIVTKDVPDYAVVAGNPAKVIKLLSPQ